MSSRSVLFASVCTVLLAASAAVSGASADAKYSATQTSLAAYKALQAGKHENAIAQYTQAIESRRLSPEMLANSLLNRALAHQKIKKFDKAIGDYSAALRVDALGKRMRAVALYNRGLAYQKVDKPAMAIEDFTNALFLDPAFPQAYYSRATVLRRNGQYLFALSDYDKAIKHKHPATHLPYFGKALTYKALKRPDSAHEALVAALKAKPDYRPARVQLARLIKPKQESGSTAVAVNPDVPVKKAVFLPQPAADNIVTGSLFPGRPDTVVARSAKPTPVAPPDNFLAGANFIGGSDSEEKVVIKRSPRGKIVARLQQEDMPAPQPSPRAVPTPEPAIEAETEVVARVTETRLSGWTIQLSSQRNAEAAWSHWNKLKSRHGRTLSSQQAAVVKADLGDRGIFYRLRVHAIDDKNEAVNLCNKLKRRGTSCFVRKAEI